MKRGRFALLVAAAAAAPFLAALGNGFTNWDDPIYLTANPRVRAGLGAASFEWAFTTNAAGNWHPLTWLSHQLDWTLFGEVAAGHHGVSIVLHAASAALLFLALARATGSHGRAAAAAILWAVHPLRVESVAWAAERKDVLSTFFWALGMLLWVERCRRPGTLRYLAVLGVFGLGLLSKPMVVSFPAALLMIDLWPLGRARDRASARALVVEKVPFFVLAAVSSWITLAVQRGAMSGAATVPLPWRLGNALIACATYVLQTFWPSGLSPFYPHPGPNLAAWKIAGSALLLAAATAGVLRARTRAPYLLFGWTWFLVTLVPVIGIVQVGSQAMADRYTYVPGIGLAIAVVWGAAELLARIGAPARAGGVAATVAALALAPATWAQTTIWRTSTTLFTRALEVDPRNPLAHNNLGLALEAEGRIDEALAHYRAVLEVNPHHADALGNLALALVWKGDLASAEDPLRAFLRERPDDAEAHFGLSRALDARGATDEALAEADRAEALGLASPEFLTHAAWLRLRANRLDDARRSLEALVAARPDLDAPRANLAAVYDRLGRPDDARRVRQGGTPRR